MPPADISILDELALAVQDTLKYYRECITSGRHMDAGQCLSAVAELTAQAHAIEDHPRLIQPDYVVHGIASAPSPGFYAAN